MDDITLTRTLLAQGFGHAELLRMQRRGELSRVRRGAYATGPIPEQPVGPEVDKRHLQLIFATAPQLLPGRWSATGRRPCSTDCRSGRGR